MEQEKNWPMTSSLAYFVTASVMKKNMFYDIDSCQCFETFSVNEPGNFYQASLILVGQVYLSGASLVAGLTNIRLRQAFKLILIRISDEEKKFHNIDKSCQCFETFSITDQASVIFVGQAYSSGASKVGRPTNIRLG